MSKATVNLMVRDSADNRVAASCWFGFYPQAAFWAVEAPDLEDVEKIWATSFRRAEKLFERKLSEVVLRYRGQGYDLKICRDGLFLLKSFVPQDERANYKVSLIWSLEVFNSIFLLLNSACLGLYDWKYFGWEEVTINQVLPFTSRGKYNFPAVIITSLQSDYIFHRRLNFYNAGEPLSSNHRLDRGDVPREVLEQVGRNLRKCGSDQQKLKVLAQINRSIAQYSIFNYSSALVLAWFLIERFLVARWQTYFRSKNRKGKLPRVSRDREKILLGRDYTISVVSNILELADILDSDLFSKINLVRKMRNNIVHENQEATQSGCLTAYKILEHFICEDYDIDLHLDAFHPMDFAQ